MLPLGDTWLAQCQAGAIFPKADQVTVQHQLLLFANHSHCKFRQESIWSPLNPIALWIFFFFALEYEGTVFKRRFGIEIYRLNLFHIT
jgi:hypothetical protein